MEDTRPRREHAHSAETPILHSNFSTPFALWSGLMLGAITLALAIASALLGYVVWVKSRRRHVDADFSGSSEVGALVHSFAALTWGRVIEGNRVEVIQNSAFFDALLADFARARHHIHIETFLWRDGAVSRRVADALSAAAVRGVRVRVLVDQRGAKKTSSSVWAEIRRAGCDFRVYHRARLREFAWYNHRDHRKIAVVDGAIAYTFGHGIDDLWGGTPDHPAGWRDTALRITGPAVTELQAAFCDNWVRSSGLAPAGADYFRALPPCGTTALHVAYLTPRETASAVQRLYYFAISAARREIILQNPYFLPDRQARRLFAAAAKRGVRIRIMLPTSDTSDFPIVQHASHYFYGELLRLGVDVYEYTRSGLHQKVMIVDGVWCSVGSTNFDPRSFRLNDEITIGIADPAIAAELINAFENDLTGATKWTLERWNARTTRHRITDRISALAKRQL